jgi:hypothetical protein
MDCYEFGERKNVHRGEFNGTFIWTKRNEMPSVKGKQKVDKHRKYMSVAEKGRKLMNARATVIKLLSGACYTFKNFCKFFYFRKSILMGIFFCYYVSNSILFWLSKIIQACASKNNKKRKACAWAFHGCFLWY